MLSPVPVAAVGISAGRAAVRIVVGGLVCPGLLQCLSWLKGEVWLHKAKCFVIPPSHFRPSLL